MLRARSRGDTQSSFLPYAAMLSAALLGVVSLPSRAEAAASAAVLAAMDLQQEATRLVELAGPAASGDGEALQQLVRAYTGLEAQLQAMRDAHRGRLLGSGLGTPAEVLNEMGREAMLLSMFVDSIAQQSEPLVAARAEIQRLTDQSGALQGLADRLQQRLMEARANPPQLQAAVSMIVLPERFRARTQRLAEGRGAAEDASFRLPRECRMFGEALELLERGGGPDALPALAAGPARELVLELRDEFGATAERCAALQGAADAMVSAEQSALKLQEKSKRLRSLARDFVAAKLAVGGQSQ